MLQRVAEEVVETRASSCIIICDTPGLGKKAFKHRSIRRGQNAVKDAYKEWYIDGVGVGPGNLPHNLSLRNANFHPSLFFADASYHDMLQMADMVVGAVSEWVYDVQNNCSDSWIFNQIKKLSCRFRAKHGHPSFWGDGLVLWPRQNKLWDALKKSIQ